MLGVCCELFSTDLGKALGTLRRLCIFSFLWVGSEGIACA